MRRSTFIVIAIAALEGAAGVGLSAAAAHIDASPLVETAGRFAMIHAAAGLGLAALTAVAAAYPRWLLSAIFAMQAGVALFSGDLAVRAFTGARLFPFAAPTGGSLLIASWVALAAYALVAAIRWRDER